MKKTRIASDRWPYSFKQRFHGKDSDNMPELIRAQAERTKAELEDVRRWEDDGGLVFEIGNPLLQVAENKPPRPMEVPGED